MLSMDIGERYGAIMALAPGTGTGAGGSEVEQIPSSSLGTRFRYDSSSTLSSLAPLLYQDPA
jgi:hypothetical protein